MYLLDTNIISYWMRGDQSLMDKIKSHSPSELSLSTITLAEILYGIEKSPVKKKERRTKIKRICSQLEVRPFDEPAVGSGLFPSSLFPTTFFYALLSHTSSTSLGNGFPQAQREPQHEFGTDPWG